MNTDLAILELNARKWGTLCVSDVPAIEVERFDVIPTRPAWAVTKAGEIIERHMTFIAAYASAKVLMRNLSGESEPLAVEIRPSVVALRKALGRDESTGELMQVVRLVEAFSGDGAIEVDGKPQDGEEMVAAALGALPPDVARWHAYISRVLERCRADRERPGKVTKNDKDRRSSDPTRIRRTEAEIAAHNARRKANKTPAGGAPDARRSSGPADAA